MSGRARRPEWKRCRCGELAAVHHDDGTCPDRSGKFRKPRMGDDYRIKGPFDGPPLVDQRQPTDDGRTEDG